MEADQHNFNKNTEKLQIGTYCYCHDKDDEAYCVIVNIITNDEKYQIIDFQKNRERVVDKSSLRTICDENILTIAQEQNYQYIFNGNTEQEQNSKPQSTQTQHEIPFTDPENQLVEFWIKKKDENNGTFHCITLSVMVFILVFFCIFMPSWLGYAGLWAAMAFCAPPLFYCVPCCFKYSKDWKTEKKIMFDHQSKKVLYQKQYHGYFGHSNTEIYGDFRELESIKYEGKNGRRDCVPHDGHEIQWKFGRRSVKINVYERDGKRVVGEILDFMDKNDAQFGPLESTEGKASTM